MVRSVVKKIILLWGVLSLGLFADFVPASIDGIVAQSGFSKNEVAVYIKETKSEQVIASLNIDKRMIPASIIKVYSAYAALLELGFNYRWQTNFYTAGGNLVVQGGGDPTLASKHIRGIVNGLKARGVRSIKGNIIIDRTYFEVPSNDTSFFDENTYSAYNAMPDGLMFNEHVSKFSLVGKGGSVFVAKEIPGESFAVSNQMGRGGCAPKISVDYGAYNTTLQLTGSYSANCGRRSYTMIVAKSYRDFYYALVNELRRQGVSYRGKLVLARVPSGATKIYTHFSSTLEDVISVTLKKSNNLLARHLMLTVGAKIYGAPSNLQKGRKAIENILNRYSLLSGSATYIDNGSGLSNKSRITARSMAKVLDHAFKSYGQRWMNTLSIAGVDGTIKRRFQGSIVNGRAWMKTGTLKKVKNITGYVKSNSGKLYTVVIIVNSPRAKGAGKVLEDNIIKWVVTHNGATTGCKVDTPLESCPTKKLYVQVGSFGSQPSEEFLDRLKNAGFIHKVIRQNEYFKVIAGPFSTAQTASNALVALKNISQGAYVVEM